MSFKFISKDFHLKLKTQSSSWNLYELDNDCDLLVIDRMNDSRMNKASAMLSLSWIGHLRSIVPSSLLPIEVLAKLDPKFISLKERSWIQEKTDPIQLNFIILLDNSIIVTDLNGTRTEFAEELLGKFLLEELKGLSLSMFSKMKSLVPQIRSTTFNFGFDKDEVVKLIGCPGHLVNSNYNSTFIADFQDFWFSL